ncbi:hypothetical protein IL306_008275 [Fusarium sp. DS 682]|nr:hypothetical protein IL306_008275 [Fusarium sp. DS 682]
MLQLQVLQTGTKLFPESDNVSVQIGQLITDTMSPVMLVHSDTGSSAILKLYDRRFGTQFRAYYRNFTPYDDQAKAAFHSFLQRGVMGPFLEELDEEQSRTGHTPRTASELRDEADGVTKFEAALWRFANKDFKTETEAYTRLQDLQGVSIPKLYAVMRLLTGSKKDGYLDIYGVLLEPIVGWSLDALPDSPDTPASQEEWTSIIQHAVDAAHEVNKRGIILDDSAPRNVVVDQTTYQPFLIDFAQCFFKDTMFSPREEEAEGWDADLEYCEIARDHDNPGAIGRVMQRRLQKMFGWKLDIAYPESGDLLSEIKRQTRSPDT